MGEIYQLRVPQKLENMVDPPKQLYAIGAGLEVLESRPSIAVVGSRKVTPYGVQVTRLLAGQLAARGITVISGLAYGVDALAHQAALEAGGHTIAVLAGGLDDIYPRSHRKLARDIIASGGSLVSEYQTGVEPRPHQFIARNRIIAGLADAVLLTEAAARSGSLHTADFATQMGKEIYGVPGPITSPTSAGVHALLRDGANPVFTIDDIKLAAGREPVSASGEVTGPEARILQLVGQGISDAAELLRQSGLSIEQFNLHLTLLEIAGRLKPAGPGQWSL